MPHEEKTHVEEGSHEETSHEEMTHEEASHEEMPHEETSHEEMPHEETSHEMSGKNIWIIKWNMQSKQKRLNKKSISKISFLISTCISLAPKS
jgi:hypothetical protein